MSKRVVMLVALILAWASALHAQASGAIRGHVQLPDSTPAAGARVALRGTTYLTTTDSAGDFDIDSVVPGLYLVVASREGQNPGTSPTRVVAGETVVVRVTLGGPVQLQEITVQASRGYVARDASTGTKSDTPIMETPLSIQVVSQQVLQDQKATTLEHALTNVSGVKSNSNFGLQESISLRGFRTSTTFRNGFRIDDALGNGLRTMTNVDQCRSAQGTGGHSVRARRARRRREHRDQAATGDALRCAGAGGRFVGSLSHQPRRHRSGRCTEDLAVSRQRFVRQEQLMAG